MEQLRQKFGEMEDHAGATSGGMTQMSETTITIAATLAPPPNQHFQHQPQEPHLKDFTWSMRSTPTPLYGSVQQAPKLPSTHFGSGLPPHVALQSDVPR